MIHINNIDTWDQASRLYPLKQESQNNDPYPNQKQSVPIAVDQLLVGQVPLIQETLATPIDPKHMAYPQQLPSLIASLGASSAHHGVAVTQLPMLADQATVKTGRLLCAKTVVWYSSQQQRKRRQQQQRQQKNQHQGSSSRQDPRDTNDGMLDQREIHRQETRLQWREFKAVLKPHCLELYLVSPLLLHGPRLAHAIYFSYHPCQQHTQDQPKRPASGQPRHRHRQQQQRRNHRLHRPRFHQTDASLTNLTIDLDDFTICLQHENKTGGQTTYQLQASTARTAQEWYMALYRCIPQAQLDPFFFPDTRHSKPAWPDAIEVHIPWIQPATIRLPLAVADAQPSQDGSMLVIRADDLRHCLFDLLHELPGNHHLPLSIDRLALCWHHHGDSHPATFSRQGRMEWIDGNASVLGPQCIQKQHTLELHDLDKERAQELPKIPRPLEDFLFKSTYEDGKFKMQHQQVRWYGVMTGHFLFLVDPAHAKLPPHVQPAPDYRAQTWFAQATASIPQFSKKFLTKASLTRAHLWPKSFHWRHHQQRPPSAVGSDITHASQWEREHLQELMRLASQTHGAATVVDLTLVRHVQPVKTKSQQQQQRSGSPSASPGGSGSLHPQVSSPLGSSSNLMDDWAKRRKRLFEICYATGSSIQLEATSAQAMFEWIRRLRKAMEYARACQQQGVVAVQASASLWYRRMEQPILQSGTLYVRLDRQKTYQRYLCVLSRGHGLNLYRYQSGGPMVKSVHVSLNNDRATYVYGVSRGEDVQQEPGPTHLFTAEGVVERQRVEDCAFVLWQRYSFSKHHVAVLIKEHISHLKLGHRLGRKGASFTFLAASQQEKEAWLWSIQHEMEQFSYC
ncbi:hypothetical protein DM01DRAFT_1340928 [Hesseltinella vesiculosa]|uniref:PH domain-containing protein n=1 Tax=Hesseltinella vesiculosa TaxID=101127 RepID=A0A1X2G2J9_9FUNG|nr:hypothetical protein DM01DRAFT_1340928 [Hesseltinella vesiculosa]